MVEAWKDIMRLDLQPAAIILWRQDVPTLDRAKYAQASGLARGFFLAEAPGGKPESCCWPPAAKSPSALAAPERTCAEGIRSRVVSIPSWELFDDQDAAYRDSVLPPWHQARVSVELASVFGWAKYVGTNGQSIGMRSFGASAPLKDLQREFGFSVERVVDAAKAQIAAGERRDVLRLNEEKFSMKIALAADHGGFDMKQLVDREAAHGRARGERLRCPDPIPATTTLTTLRSLTPWPPDAIAGSSSAAAASALRGRQQSEGGRAGFATTIIRFVSGLKTTI